jgi:predicted HD superfamily hydrolase involved in NAD metabolism
LGYINRERIYRKVWSEEKIEAYLKERLEPKRFKHVLGVVQVAEQLADIYKENREKARLSALVHDCAKNMSSEEIIKLVKDSGYSLDGVCNNCPELVHGLAGAIIGKTVMGIEDSEVFDAARYHTTGRKAMSLLEKIVYLADYIEPSRNFPGVEKLREAAFENIDRAVLMALDNTIKYVIKKGQLLHTDTVDTRNYFICRE